MYTIFGATGNIGSVITRVLLEKGEQVRVVGRNAGKLQKYVQKGAEAFVGDVSDEAAMAQALSGARAGFLMIPPNPTSPDYRAEQERVSDSIAAAVKKSALHYAVNLSSFGAQAETGTGPISGLHRFEKKLNAIEKLNVLHLRPVYFFENHLEQHQHDPDDGNDRRGLESGFGHAANSDAGHRRVRRRATPEAGLQRKTDSRTARAARFEHE